MNRLLLVILLVGAGYLIFVRRPAPHQRIYHYKDESGHTVFTNELQAVPPEQRATATQSEDLARISTADFDDVVATYGPEQREERRKRLEAERKGNAHARKESPFPGNANIPSLLGQNPQADLAQRIEQQFRQVEASLAEAGGAPQTKQQVPTNLRAPEFDYNSEVNYGCFSGSDGGVCAGQ